NVNVAPNQLFTADATNLTPDPSAQAGAVKVFNTSEFSPGIGLSGSQGQADPQRFPIGFGAGTNGVEAVVNLQANGQVVANPVPIPGFIGPITRAAGDFNGDGIPDTVWAVAGGGGPLVRIIAGGSGQVLADFFALTPSFTGGVTVAVA